MKIVDFFQSHSVCKEVLLETTTQNSGKPLSPQLSCPTRCSTDFFMIRRNMRIKAAFVAAILDARLSRDVRVILDKAVRDCLLDEVNFWL